MPAFEDGPTPPLNADLREALDAYRSDSNTANWNRLSQLYIGEIQVIDALQTLDPAFPDPYPLDLFFHGYEQTDEHHLSGLYRPAQTDRRRARTSARYA